MLTIKKTKIPHKSNYLNTFNIQPNADLHVYKLNINSNR